MVYVVNQYTDVFSICFVCPTFFPLEFSKQVQRLMMVDFSKALTTQELP